MAVDAGPPKTELSRSYRRSSWRSDERGCGWSLGRRDRLERCALLDMR